MLAELNALMPKDIRFSRSDYPLSKTNMNPKLIEFAKKYPDLYSRNIHKIRELGEEVGYKSGHNVGLDDMFLKNQSQIDKKLNGIEKQISHSTKENSKKILIRSFNDIQKMTVANSGNNIVTQAQSKGRGNPATAARSIGSVVFAVDMNSEPYPFLIKNSLAKGLNAHEQYASGGQARFAAVQTAVSTSQPGAMGKILIANAEGLKISEKDCGTRNGVEERIDDGSLIGRYEAGTNSLITNRLLSDRKKRGKKRILVRSATTCRSKKGVCSMCYGKTTSGGTANIGHNAGIEAAQTVSEKATQLILSAKHNVQGRSKSTIPTGFEAQKILLNPTDKYKGKSTLSSTEGKVDSIEKLPIGGYSISVAGEKHHVGHDVFPLVKPGDMITKGQKISSGLTSTRDVVQHKGILEARNYLATELHKANGGKIDKRNFEIIARGYLNLSKNKNDVSNESMFDFDSHVQTLTPPYTQTLKVNNPQVTNKFLVDAFETNSPGARVTSAMVKKAKSHGVNEFKVSHSPMAYTPVFKTYEQKPQHSGSLWQKINFRGINKAIKNDLLFGERTDLNRLGSDRAKYSVGTL